MEPLTIAIGNHGLTAALKQGTIQSDRVKLQHIEITPITAAMRRMVRSLEFDICEMAFATYLCARASGKAITAIPIFLTRNFHHWALFYNVNSGIRVPKDLEGRRVGVHRGYTVTTGLWARGMLQSEYGVDVNKITWVPTDDEHVPEFQPPPNVDYSYKGKPMLELLLSGVVDAAVGDIRVNEPQIQPLIPDARNAGFAYHRKTGIYPINHGLVINNTTLQSKPWLAEELFHLFKAAKDSYLTRLRTASDLSPADKSAMEVERELGLDPFPFGIEANRKTLDAINQFAVDQHLIRTAFTPEQIFAPTTLSLE